MEEANEKENPAYKGKWFAPLIDNPDYKGIWKPKDIPNPAYFVLDKPDFEPIAAVGIEIWTMQDGILFDNILIAHSEKVAESYRETTWKPKFLAEKEKQKAEESSTSSGGLEGFQKKIFSFLRKIADVPFLSAHKLKIYDLLEKGEKQSNLTIGILVAVALVVFTILMKLIFGGKKTRKTVEKTGEGSSEPSQAESSAEKEEGSEKEEAPGVPRRRTSRRDD